MELVFYAFVVLNLAGLWWRVFHLPPASPVFPEPKVISWGEFQSSHGRFKVRRLGGATWSFNDAMLASLKIEEEKTAGHNGQYFFEDKLVKEW